MVTQRATVYVHGLCFMWVMHKSSFTTILITASVLHVPYVLKKPTKDTIFVSPVRNEAELPL
jgi:hypothetical protein